LQNWGSWAHTAISEHSPALRGIYEGGLMRLGSFTAVVFLVGTAACFAQDPTTKFIMVPEVEVRSGPSFNFYPTSMLRQNDSVRIVTETAPQPDWVAIAPPAGSFSWINAKAVKRKEGQPSLGIVDSDVPVPVMPGSSVTSKAPNVEQVKLEKGTVVVILDETLAEGAYLAIQPPVNEVRYIPAQAIKPQQFVGSPAAPNPLPGLGNETIAQADQALKAGNIERAKQLYNQAAQSTNNYQDKIRCYNALVSLGDGPRNHPGHPDQAQGVAMTPSGHLSGATAPLFKTAQIQRGTVQPAQWSAWGVLRVAAFKSEDGQPMYVLENQKGQPLLYASAQQGLSLNNFIGRTICLYGPITYRSDDYVRMHHMVASHIALP